MNTFQDVINDLDLLDIEFDNRKAGFAKEVKSNLVEDIFIQDSIDRGWFIQSIDYFVLGDTFTVSTQKDKRVGYSGFLEFPNKIRRDQRGRYHSRNAIENSDFSYVLDSIMDNTFSNSYVY